MRCAIPNLQHGSLELPFFHSTFQIIYKLLHSLKYFPLNTTYHYTIIILKTRSSVFVNNLFSNQLFYSIPINSDLYTLRIQTTLNPRRVCFLYLCAGIQNHSCVNTQIKNDATLNFVIEKLHRKSPSCGCSNISKKISPRYPPRRQ